MRLHCGQKCSSTGAPAPQLRHSRVETGLTGIESGVMGRSIPGASRAEGAAATAGLLRVRVVEHEALGQKRGVVVECRALQKQIALLVDEDLGAVALEDLVTHPGFLLPGERVAQARATAALHADTKTAVVDALLGHQRLDLPGSAFAYFDHVNSQLPTPNSQPLPNSQHPHLGVGSWQLEVRRQALG